jgi:hypothetical protein
MACGEKMALSSAPLSVAGLSLATVAALITLIVVVSETCNAGAFGLKAADRVCSGEVMGGGVGEVSRACAWLVKATKRVAARSLLSLKGEEEWELEWEVDMINPFIVYRVYADLLSQR